MIDRYQSIVIFIDGEYYVKINEALQVGMYLNINVS